MFPAFAGYEHPHMHLPQIALLSLQAAICSMHSADLTLEKAFLKMSLGLEMAQ